MTRTCVAAFFLFLKSMETFASHSAPAPSSDRMFGCVMAAFFLVIATFPLLSAEPARIWALILGSGFFFLAILFPKALSLPNKCWSRFGSFMSGIVSPVALGVLFFGVITPYGWLMKISGKSFIPTRFDPSARSYWTMRDPAGPAPETLQNQF